MAAFFDFRVVLDQWAQAGMFDVLLPLLLVFVIIYSILHQSKIMGGIKAIDAVIACIVAFFVVANPYATSLFLPIFSQAGLAIIILVAVMLVIGLFLEKGEMSKTLRTVLAVFGVSLFLWLFSRMMETFGNQGIFMGFQTWFFANSTWLIPLLLVAIVFIGVLSSEKGPAKQTAAAPAQAAQRS